MFLGRILQYFFFEFIDFDFNSFNQKKDFCFYEKELGV